jgi:hypothetical protein
MEILLNSKTDMCEIDGKELKIKELKLKEMEKNAQGMEAFYKELEENMLKVDDLTKEKN